MANPAQLLLSRLNSWNHPRSTAEAARQVNQQGTWLYHRIAVHHLEAIEELLDEMEEAGRNVSVYRRYLPAWASIIFAYPRGWQTQNSGSIDPNTLEHLENLADRLDDFVPVVRPNGLDELRDYANGIREILEDDESLHELLKLHVKQVIAHLNWCIDTYDAVGDFDLREAVERLAAAIISAGANSRHKGKWKAAMDTFVWPFTVNVIAAIPSNALSLLALSG